MKILAFLGSIFLAALIGLLAVYIIIDVARLFQLPFLTELSFAQVYGLYSLINLMKFKFTKEDLEKEAEDDEKAFAKSIAIAVIYTIFLMLFWGMSYIMNFIVV
jgi:hypothetical protein